MTTHLPRPRLVLVLAALAAVDPSVTIRHLLTMSGGWAWTEQGAVGYNEWILSGDHLA